MMLEHPETGHLDTTRFATVLTISTLPRGTRYGALFYLPLALCLLLLPATLWADCSPDVLDNPLTPEDESQPVSGGMVVCDGVDTNGFVRVDDPTQPFLNRDNLVVTVTGNVSRNAGDVIELQGDSHAIILDGGTINGTAHVDGMFPAFTVLGDGSAERLLATGDGAFLDVSGLAGIGDITLNGANANATITGSQIGTMQILGDTPRFNMSGGLIGVGLQISGVNGTVSFAGGVVQRTEIVGDGSMVTVDGGGFNEVFRVEGDNVVVDLNAGNFFGTVELAGADATLTNRTIIQGGVGNFGDALVDNFGSILGAGLFMTEAGGSLLNRGNVTTVDDDANAVFSAAANHEVDNRGTLTTSGNTADAVVFEGNNASLINRLGGAIGTTGDESGAIYSEGDQTTVDNLAGAFIGTSGDGSSGVFLQGDGSTINNAGGVITEGLLAPALTVFGANGLIDNNQDVSTQGQTSFGLTLASRRNDAAPNPRAPTLTNSARVETTADFSSAIVGLGADLVITNEEGGELVTGTLASEAHGIVLGFQDAPPIPVGIAIPLGVFDPAQGTVINDGMISTAGFASSGIHAFANDSRIENRNSIVTTGGFADGIDAAGDNLTIVNDGIVQLQGDNGAGIRVDGNDATVEVRAMVEGGPDKLVSVLGDLVDGVNALGDRLELWVEGLIVAGADSSDGAKGVRFDGAAAKLLVEGTIDANGQNAGGIVGTNANTADLINNGAIDVAGIDPVGIDVTGDNLRVNNVSFDPVSGPRVDAQIIADGDNAVGIRTSGAGAFVSNRKSELDDGTEIVGLDVSGEFARGIDVIATGNGGYLVENAGWIRINGTSPAGAPINSNVGMALRNVTTAPIVFDQNNFQSSCLGSGAGAGFLNCGRIELNGPNSIGMLAGGISDSIVENSGDITGVNDGLTGIEVRSIFGTARSNDNIILSLEDITLTGSGAIGISITGDDNVLMHGQDVVVQNVDTGAIDIPTIEVISVAIDRQSSLPNADSMPLAELLVDGPNSTGISINGQNNVVAISLVTQRVTLPGGDAVFTDLPAEVVALGPGSVGVKFEGSGNKLLHMGRIQADGLAIEGSDGNDEVVAFGSVVGATDLAGGNDRFEFAVVDAFEPDTAADLRAIRGDVDGGDGDDRLQVNTGDLFPNQNVIKIGNIDGEQFTNFEHFDVLGEIPVILDNTLDLATPSTGVSTATVVDGSLILNFDSLLSAQYIEVRSGAEILGFGTLGVGPTGPGFVDRTTVNILDGGSISGGNSPGTLTIFGDLELDGTLLTEVDGILPGQFDQLDVLGDVSLGDSAVFDIAFGDGFAPQEGDIFEFLLADTVQGNLDLLTINILGLQPGFEYDLGLGANGLMLTALNDGVSQVPVPPALLLFVSGLLGIAGVAHRRRSPSPGVRS